MLVLRDPDEGCTVLVDNQENRRRYARMIAEQKQHEAAELHCIAANQAAERLIRKERAITARPRSPQTRGNYTVTFAHKAERRRTLGLPPIKQLANLPTTGATVDLADLDDPFVGVQRMDHEDDDVSTERAQRTTLYASTEDDDRELGTDDDNSDRMTWTTPRRRLRTSWQRALPNGQERRRTSKRSIGGRARGASADEQAGVSASDSSPQAPALQSTASSIVNGENDTCADGSPAEQEDGHYRTQAALLRQLARDREERRRQTDSAAEMQRWRLLATTILHRVNR